jgi:ferritin-like metal-binding protein YciE
MPELNERDMKIVQYLREAHSKERELEVSLQTHIEQTTRMPYKKRLRQHLTETRNHGKALEKRIRQLGGGDSLISDAGHVASSAIGVGKAVAKAPIEMVRGTGEQEQMLKNAKDEFKEENAEIAMYKSIEAFAESVGDKDTAKVARSILREEERMAKYLEGQLPVIAKAVASDEVPAKQRTTSGRRRAAAARGGRASSGRASSGRSSGRRVASRA